MIIRPTLNFDKTIKYMTYATSAYSFKYVKSKVYVNKICTYYINEGYSDLLIRFWQMKYQIKSIGEYLKMVGEKIQFHETFLFA